jgi:tetraprenyl-beta-curcumene synthase
MRADATHNAMPLSRQQWSALLAAAARELAWGLRMVSRELRIWRARANAIPDPGLRRDAIAALEDKRGHTVGAALFATLPRHRCPVLVRTVVRYELLQDLLDSVTEPGAALGPERGAPLYAALGDALDLARLPAADRMRDIGRDDGGYLTALVNACRDGCRELPGYPVVRPLLVREAERGGVLVLNHQPDASIRREGLRAWAAEHLLDLEDGLVWYERTAAVSGWITTHVLLAVAESPTVTAAEAEATYDAYFPWLALTLTLVDSYVDQADDVAAGNHNYLAHFPSADAAVERLRESVSRAAHDVLTLPHGERHAVLLGCMIALYLSKDSARTPELRETTARVAAAGGALTRLLLPILRVWRICNAQRSAT